MISVRALQHNQVSYSKILAASSWVKNNSISVLLCKVSREHADVSVIHVYTKVCKWCMKPRLHFIYQVRRNLAIWGFGVFLSWYWLDTKVRRNTKEIQLASLVNHAWCCDQARWQNLNFPKQVWKLWQMRRQIIVTILGAEKIDFIIGLSLKIPLPVTAWWVSHVLSFQPLSHLCARCRTLWVPLEVWTHRLNCSLLAFRHPCSCCLQQAHTENVPDYLVETGN